MFAFYYRTLLHVATLVKMLIMISYEIQQAASQVTGIRVFLVATAFICFVFKDAHEIDRHFVISIILIIIVCPFLLDDKVFSYFFMIVYDAVDYFVGPLFVIRFHVFMKFKACVSSGKKARKAFNCYPNINFNINKVI